MKVLLSHTAASDESNICTGADTIYITKKNKKQQQQQTNKKTNNPPKKKLPKKQNKTKKNPVVGT